MKGPLKAQKWPQAVFVWRRRPPGEGREVASTPPVSGPSHPGTQVSQEVPGEEGGGRPGAANRQNHFRHFLLCPIPLWPALAKSNNENMIMMWRIFVITIVIGGSPEGGPWRVRPEE